MKPADMREARNNSIKLDLSNLEKESYEEGKINLHNYEGPTEDKKEEMKEVLNQANKAGGRYITSEDEEFIRKMNGGGTKHDSGKPQLSLVSRELMEHLAKVREFGSKKYGRNNWQSGFKYSRSIDAALRHLMAINSGENIDEESGCYHAAAVIANMEHLLHDMLYRPHNDDRDT